MLLKEIFSWHEKLIPLFITSYNLRKSKIFSFFISILTFRLLHTKATEDVAGIFISVLLVWKCLLNSSSHGFVFSCTSRTNSDCFHAIERAFKLIKEFEMLIASRVSLYYFFFGTNLFQLIFVSNWICKIEAEQSFFFMYLLL